jgi:hypothetical protein
VATSGFELVYVKVRFELVKATGEKSKSKVDLYGKLSNVIVWLAFDIIPVRPVG